jgi:hypothetical protein
MMEHNSNWPPKFRVNEEKVLNLFTGDRFYSSSDAALREAILNAIDACVRRDRVENNEYQPKIEVIFDEETHQITIRDNGDGMGKDEILDLFTQIGSTAADLAQRSDSEKKQQVGEFGIGVVSYFLICEKYELHTVSVSDDPIGVCLTKKMLDAKTKAKEISPSRNKRGTTLILPVKTSEIYENLKEKFSHWVRDVEYLEAWIEPAGDRMSQGGTPEPYSIEIDELPDWIEQINVGPPTDFNSWQHLDGNGRVDLLYKGVFVEKLNPSQLWGLEGSIHVDPKSFKAKLNREGFIGDEDKQKIVRFLKKMHPKALEKAIECIRDIDFPSNQWDKLKWINLWLAIPRNDAYKSAATIWDKEFHDLEVFELLLPNDESKSISVADIAKMNTDQIYLAPPKLNRIGELGRQAVRVLRAQRTPVLQGKKRESGYLRNASFIGSSSMDILDYFSEELPHLVKISTQKEEIVRSEHEASIFGESPEVLIVRLGKNGSTMLKVGNEIWINVESEKGKLVIKEICERNEGYLGLWIACLKFAPNQAARIAGALQDKLEKKHNLGIVKRQYLRRLAQ